MDSNSKFKPFAYYLSQYCWILYMIIPLIFVILLPAKTSKSTIFSSNSKFDNKKDPIVFAHLSDTHINVLRPSSIDTFRQMIKLVKFYSPEFIIHTGDIVDNYDSISFPRYGDQNEANWQVYKEETKSLSNIQIIECGGNHDMFGIKSAMSNKNYIIDSNHSINRKTIKNEDDFLVKSIYINQSKINIIAVNPFNFPTPHAPLMMVTTFSKHLLDLLEIEINKSDMKNLVISHYPTASTHSKKSSSGKKFSEIIDSKNSVLAFLNGHWHPRKPTVSYLKKGTIEIIGTVGYIDSRFGIVTIDNDAISWTIIDNSKSQPTAVISYPISYNQLSSQTIFNDKEYTEIRVVVFSNQTNLSIAFSIIDLSNSKIIFSDFLKFSHHLINSHTLYTYPMKSCIPGNGKYKITFSGYFNGSIEFFIGESIELNVDNYGKKYLRLQNVFFYLTPLFILLLFITTFIIPLNFCNCQTKLDLIEEWIETSNSSSNYWCFIFFFGFLIVRSRLLKTPKFIQIFVFLCVLLSFIGPINLFQTENLLGFIWIYGYVIDNKILPSDYGLLYSFYYLTFICLPIIFLCSSFGVRTWSLYQIVDIIISIGLLFGDLYILLRVVHESVGSKLTCASIGFVIIPFVFIVVFCLWIFWYRKMNNRCNKNINDNTNSSITENLNTIPNQEL